MLPATQSIIGDEERQAVDRVLRSGMLAHGPEEKVSEEEFSHHVAGRRCIAVNSGTSALHMAFLATDSSQGDEVTVPHFSVAETLNADLTHYESGAAGCGWGSVQAPQSAADGDVTSFALKNVEPLLTEHLAFTEAVITGHQAQIVTLREGLTAARIADTMVSR